MPKLVRDRIPEILVSQGKTVDFYVADDKEYEIRLCEKLQEETSEFLDSKEQEELADILEVVHAICDKNGWSLDQLEEVRLNKKSERGAFKQKYIL